MCAINRQNQHSQSLSKNVIFLGSGTHWASCSSSFEHEHEEEDPCADSSKEIVDQTLQNTVAVSVIMRLKEAWRSRNAMTSPVLRYLELYNLKQRDYEQMLTLRAFLPFTLFYAQLQMTVQSHTHFWSPACQSEKAVPQFLVFGFVDCEAFTFPLNLPLTLKPWPWVKFLCPPSGHQTAQTTLPLVNTCYLKIR